MTRIETIRLILALATQQKWEVYQATIALSSTEAEYVAVTITACQVVWLRRLMGDLMQEQMEPIVIYCDSQSIVTMTRNQVMHGRTKHIEIKHHYIRDLVAASVI